MPNTSIGETDLTSVVDAVTPIVEEAGLVLEAVELPGGEPPVLRVVVDRAEGVEGVDLDQIGTLSEAIGDVLDAGVLSGNTPYDLEVASPGATRPLTQPRHWRRNVDRMVNVVLEDGERVHGLLLDATEESIEVEPVRPAPKKGMKAKVLAPVRFEYDHIRKGKVDIDATAARLLKMNNDSEEA